MSGPQSLTAHLSQQNQKDLLRFITCGSVDDGKSTLIGRMLYDSQLLFEDHLASLKRDSAKFGTAGSELDLALLVDGLAAEREQGITIDVAYRFFATGKRKFIVADTPGHEQYTRNMVTGASTATLAVLLIDARKGVLTQTRRHSFLVALMGLRHVVLAINKMDLVDYAQDRFEAIVADYRAFATELGFAGVTAIPVSALTGANVTVPAAEMPWYAGPALLPHLETVAVEADPSAGAFRFPIQWVNRPHQDFRGYCGTVAGGTVRVGDAVAVEPGGRTTRVARIVTMDGERETARAGDAITLVLADQVEASRGTVIVHPDTRPEVADQFAAQLVWMSDQPLYTGRKYWLQAGPRAVAAQVTEIKHAIDVNTLARLPAKHLSLNEIAVCNLALDQAIPFDPYRDNHRTGGFILIDRITNATVGCGMLSFALRRSANVRWQHTEVDKHARAVLNGHRPCVLWFTGLSGSGKSTIANALERRLHAHGCHTYLLDGDNLRHGLNRNLGFTVDDRVENIRRVAECARLFVDAGLIVLVSVISPFRAERKMARELLEPGEFIEIFVDTPLGVCEARDVKGLYRKARAGQLKNFTGIDSPYEVPEAPDLTLSTQDQTPDALAAQVVEVLEARQLLTTPDPTAA